MRLASFALALLCLPAAFAGSPPIKTQQCSVLPLGGFQIPWDTPLFIGNRNDSVLNYTSPLTELTPGYLSGAPALNLAGTATGLSLVSKNYLAGITRDTAGHLFIVNPGLQTVTIYKAGATGNQAPMLTIPTSAGLSQPAGIALDRINSIIYVSNPGNGTLTAYRVTFSTATGPETATYTRLTVAAVSGLSAPLGLALNPAFNTLYVANKGNNTVGVYLVSVSGDNVTITPRTAPALNSLSGPIGLALSPSGGVLYIANNGKYNNWYNVTAYSLDAGGIPAANPVAVISGDKTGLCNPAALVAVRSNIAGFDFLAVANRESSGGSITFYKLTANGLFVNSVAADPTNVRPEAMVLHDAVNLLAAPVGITN